MAAALCAAGTSIAGSLGYPGLSIPCATCVAKRLPLSLLLPQFVRFSLKKLPCTVLKLVASGPGNGSRCRLGSPTAARHLSPKHCRSPAALCSPPAAPRCPRCESRLGISSSFAAPQGHHPALRPRGHDGPRHPRATRVVRGGPRRHHHAGERSSFTSTAPHVPSAATKSTQPADALPLELSGMFQGMWGARWACGGGDRDDGQKGRRQGGLGDGRAQHKQEGVPGRRTCTPGGIAHEPPPFPSRTWRIAGLNHRPVDGRHSWLVGAPNCTWARASSGHLHCNSNESPATSAHAGVLCHSRRQWEHRQRPEPSPFALHLFSGPGGAPPGHRVGWGPGPGLQPPGHFARFKRQRRR